MEEKKTSAAFRLIKGLVRLFYPKIEIVGAENLPDEPCIIVGNHSKMNGPIACELYFPGRRRIWCAGEMMHADEAAEYAYNDFWSAKPRWSRWFWKMLSHLIVPLAVCVFNNANTVPVYHDGRLLTTFRTSIKLLEEGNSMLIFPEHNVPHNNIVYDFQDKFVDLARMYHKKTGRELSFVPMYLSPQLKKICIGSPIRFDSAAPIKVERERICALLMEAITELAAALPRHRVVPYPNMPKKYYPYSLPIEVNANEKTCG